MFLSLPCLTEKRKRKNRKFHDAYAKDENSIITLTRRTIRYSVLALPPLISRMNAYLAFSP